MNKILITGGSGLLAINWAITKREECLVTLGLHEKKITIHGIKNVPLSLDSIDSIKKVFDVVQPNIVIHTAGLTSVEACEKNPELAHYVNVELAENVANVCNILKIPQVHISTDHLFSGEALFVEETQLVSPQNVYGRSKADAEIRVLDANPDALVVRTNFFGWGPVYRASFSDMIINNLRMGHAVNLFQDVYYTPILSEVLVNIVHQLVELKQNGICNVVGDERISKYDFGIKLANQFNLDSNLINPGFFADLPDLVQRPYDMSLSNKRVCNILGQKVGGVNEHIKMLYQQEQRGITKEIQSL